MSVRRLTEDEIINISFAMSNYHHLRLVDRIMTLENKIKLLEEEQGQQE